MHDSRMKRHLAEFDAYCEGIVLGALFMSCLAAAGQCVREQSWAWFGVSLFFAFAFGWVAVSKYRRLYAAAYPTKRVGRDGK